MSAETTRAPRASQRRGSKREAILQAAIEVFGREGYALASVDEIAHLAGVAKPTLYSRFSDKTTLFNEAVLHAAAQSNQAVTDVIDATSTTPEDLRAEFEHLGVALVGCVMHENGAAVIRLQMTEHARFGPTFDEIRAQNRHRILDRLAGKIAQLAATGQLRIPDPQRAARHFLALINDDALARSGYGTSVLSPEDVADSVAEAVDTFLRAFGNSTADPSTSSGTPRTDPLTT
ncbi:TetR/AcrR family transcriptional regulator [Rhodococcus rhodochrous]|uniref:TetR/AcrR family transcriptional regulator n=1 Tax=Rhodococcus rhodochrous TaxID=1829 RepID=UPI0011A96B9A|nr:TetR/AcrR family transcriptional regulator [Rhodococcus rhodochrous]TWH38306.1 TetR family transcriptional regulator [Rhodococcus rhodochrous J38]